MIGLRSVPAFAVAASFLAALPSLPHAEQKPDAESMAALASDYVAGYVRTLASVVCEERYELQLHRQTIYFEGAAPKPRDIVVSRVLVSDYLLVQLPGTRGWMGFRDVFSVDGAAIRDREERLTRLFLEPGARALEQAEQIRGESARYNIGSGTWDINVPTFALQFLLPDIRRRFAFRTGGKDAVDGVVAETLEYTETTRPTLIEGRNGEPVPAKGLVWIDPANGTVLRTRLETRSGDKRTKIEVSFKREPKLGMMVPVEMLEWHEMASETVLGAASYGHYRQFKVETSEQIK